MAEDKKGFILYADLIHTIEQMPADKAGELFLHILRYVNDKDPQSNDLLVNLTFEPIKQQLKRDLAKWEERKSNYSKAGKASAAARIKEEQLYVIRCYDENESFIKVGVCGQSIGVRYGNGNNKAMPYQYDIIARFSQKDGQSIVAIENIIESEFKEYKIIPQRKFAGYLECYSTSIESQIVTKLTSLKDAERCLTIYNTHEYTPKSSTVSVISNSKSNSQCESNSILIKGKAVHLDAIHSKQSSIDYLLADEEMVRAATELIKCEDWQTKILLNRFINTNKLGTEFSTESYGNIRMHFSRWIKTQDLPQKQAIKPKRPMGEGDEW